MSQDIRFQSSGLNKQFPANCHSIDEYIALMRKIIAQTRCDLSPQHGNTIINANSPRYSQGTDPIRAIILIHGLFNSANVMASLHDSLNQAGFSVFSVLLPGHGTRPGDLLDVSIEDWFACLQFAINQLQGKQITLLGYSLGAGIATALCQMAYPIDRLILLAPLIETTTSFRSLLPAYNQLKTLSERYIWHNQFDDLNYTKYQSSPVNVYYQCHRLIKLIHKNNQTAKLSLPIKLIVSSDDETICYKSAIEFVTAQSNRLNQITVYSNDKSIIDTATITVKKSHYPRQNIVDFSHTSLPANPCHRHYGIEGDFNDFLHYAKNEKNNRFNKTVKLGAINDKNKQHYHMERLHYNPDYSNMVQSIIHFLNID